LCLLVDASYATAYGEKDTHDGRFHSRRMIIEREEFRKRKESSSWPKFPNKIGDIDRSVFVIQISVGEAQLNMPPHTTGMEENLRGGRSQK
jgi:hypothetical protein